MSLEIITTSDGSHSLFNSELNETYHSVHGAIQESQHVFIKKGLDFFIENFNKPTINILEVGFGTGLNAVLTLQRSFTLPNKINYTTLEAFPLSEAIWSNLNYASQLSDDTYFQRIHTSSWRNWEAITPNFNLLKLHTTLQAAVLQPNHYDIIFFDAFAPNKQPEIWEMEILEKLHQILTINGIFVTYCAKGQLKRDLKSLTFDTKTVEGPPGKKEMVRAIKIQ